MAPKNNTKAKAPEKPKPDLHRDPQNRPVMDRLMRVVRMIKKGNYPNVNDFMAELEMSESAIRRDIAMLYRMNLGRGGILINSPSPRASLRGKGNMFLTKQPPVCCDLQGATAIKALFANRATDCRQRRPR